MASSAAKSAFCHEAWRAQPLPARRCSFWTTGAAAEKPSVRHFAISVWVDAAVRSFLSAQGRRTSVQSARAKGRESSSAPVIAGRGRLEATDTSAPYGLVHCVFELYGPTVAGKLLTVLGRLFTHYLQSHGFTCGIEDLLLSPSADATRSKLQGALPASSDAIVRDFVGLPATAEGGAVHAGMRRKMQEENWKPKLDSALRQVT